MISTNLNISGKSDRSRSGQQVRFGINILGAFTIWVAIDDRDANLDLLLVLLMSASELTRSNDSIE